MTEPTATPRSPGVPGTNRVAAADDPTRPSGTDTVRVSLDGTATVRDGTRLRFELFGRGAPNKVVLVHSLALNRGLWSEVLPLLLLRADVLVYDCRGHGESDRGEPDYTVEQFGEDLADLLDAVGWERAVVAGCSMGGCVAQAFASAHPGRAAGAVFVDTTAWYGPEAVSQWAKRASSAAKDGLASLLPFQQTRWFTEDFQRHRPEVFDRLREVFLRNDLAAYQATCRMLGAADLRDRVGAITGPTAVLVGEEDYATPPDMARSLAELLGGAPLTVLSGARHLSPLERPADIAEAITSVFARIAADGAR